MKVSTLISQLQEQDGDAKIIVYDTEMSVYYEQDRIIQWEGEYVQITRNYNKAPIDNDMFS